MDYLLRVVGPTVSALIVLLLGKQAEIGFLYSFGLGAVVIVLSTVSNVQYYKEGSQLFKKESDDEGI